MTDQLPLDGTGLPEPSLDPELPGPFPVGRYADGLKEFFRERPKVLVTGELTGFKRSRVQAFFELRDSQGALPCSIWNTDLEKLGLDPKLLADGAEVVIGGGLDYYPGSANASPSFNFRATHMRLAGDGDLLARLAAPPRGAQARRPLRAAEAARPPGAAEDDRRRHGARERGVPGPPRRARAARLARHDRVGGRAGAGPPRGAADRVARFAGLAELEQVEVAVVCRGGGSLADLWAFCDENLCRTVALLRLPVISAVGHEVDRTLIDDVSAVCCSTPTHAAEELVRVDVRAAREAVRRSREADAARRRRGDPRARASAWASSRPVRRGPSGPSAPAFTRSSARCAPRRRAALRRATSGRSATRSSSRARAPRARSRPRRSRASPPPRRRSAATIRSGCWSADTRGSSRSTGDAVTLARDAREAKDVRVRFEDGSVRARIEDDVDDE